MVIRATDPAVRAQPFRVFVNGEELNTTYCIDTRRRVIRYFVKDAGDQYVMTPNRADVLRAERRYKRGQLRMEPIPRPPTDGWLFPEKDIPFK